MACPIILTSYIMIYSYYKSPPRDSCHFQSLSASPFVLFTYYDNSEGLGIQNRIFIYVYNIVRRKLNTVFSLYLPFLAFWPIWWCYKWEWIQTLAKNCIRITRSVTNPNVQKRRIRKKVLFFGTSFDAKISISGLFRMTTSKK